MVAISAAAGFNALSPYGAPVRYVGNPAINGLIIAPSEDGDWVYKSEEKTAKNGKPYRLLLSYPQKGKDGNGQPLPDQYALVEWADVLTVLPHLTSYGSGGVWYGEWNQTRTKIGWVGSTEDGIGVNISPEYSGLERTTSVSFYVETNPTPLLTVGVPTVDAPEGFQVSALVKTVMITESAFTVVWKSKSKVFLAAAYVYWGAMPPPNPTPGEGPQPMKSVFRIDVQELEYSTEFRTYIPKTGVAAYEVYRDEVEWDSADLTTYPDPGVIWFSGLYSPADGTISCTKRVGADLKPMSVSLTDGPDGIDAVVVMHPTAAPAVGGARSGFYDFAYRYVSPYDVSWRSAVTHTTIEAVEDGFAWSVVAATESGSYGSGSTLLYIPFFGGGGASLQVSRSYRSGSRSGYVGEDNGSGLGIPASGDTVATYSIESVDASQVTSSSGVVPQGPFSYGPDAAYTPYIIPLKPDGAEYVVRVSEERTPEVNPGSVTIRTSDYPDEPYGELKTLDWKVVALEKTFLWDSMTEGAAAYLTVPAPAYGVHTKEVTKGQYTVFFNAIAHGSVGTGTSESFTYFSPEIEQQAAPKATYTRVFRNLANTYVARLSETCTAVSAVCVRAAAEEEGTEPAYTPTRYVYTVLHSNGQFTQVYDLLSVDMDVVPQKYRTPPAFYPEVPNFVRPVVEGHRLLVSVPQGFYEKYRPALPTP